MRVFERLAARRRFTEDEQLVLDQVRRLCKEEIAPRAAELDASHAFPWANIHAINALGLNGLFVPEEYGGAPMSYRLYLQVVQ